MKKFILLAGALVLMFVLVGCVKESPAKEKAPALTEEQMIEESVWTDPKYGCQYFIGGYGIKTLRQGSC